MSESPFNPSTPLSAPAGPSSPTGVAGHPEQPLFVRPRAGRVVGGVCAGVGERTGIDPLLVRIGAVALVVASGVGILVYAALWMLTPSTDGPARISTERLHGLAQRLTPRSAGGRAGRVALVVIAALAVLFASLLHDGSGFGALVVLLVLALVLSSGWLRRIIAGLIAVVVALGVATAVWGSHLSTKAVTVNDASRVDSSYRLPAGTLRLDLADLATAPGATAVGTRAMVGTGDVVVTLPRQMSVHVRARSGVGAGARARRDDPRLRPGARPRRSGGPGRRPARPGPDRRHRDCHGPQRRIAPTPPEEVHPDSCPGAPLYLAVYLAAAEDQPEGDLPSRCASWATCCSRAPPRPGSAAG